MPLRSLTWLALLALILVVPAATAADKPTLVVQIESLDRLIGDALFLAKEAGKEEEAKQAEGFLKSMTTPKGLEGVDTKKPLGLYATLGNQVTNSTVVVLIPVGEAQKIHDLLTRLGIKTTKTESGAYEFSIPNSPLPGYFRINNGYAYVTVGNEATIAPNKVLAPQAVLAGKGQTLTVNVNLDEIPG